MWLKFRIRFYFATPKNICSKANFHGQNEDIHQAKIVHSPATTAVIIRYFLISNPVNKKTTPENPRQQKKDPHPGLISVIASINIVIIAPGKRTTITAAKTAAISIHPFPVAGSPEEPSLDNTVFLIPTPPHRGHAFTIPLGPELHPQCGQTLLYTAIVIIINSQRPFRTYHS